MKKHKWKWSAGRELHYDSVGDFYRRNIQAWFLPVIGLPVIGLFMWVDATTHQRWWVLYWIALALLNLASLLMPIQTYKKVVLPHLESDRKFISNLEEQGVPVPVAQQVLEVLENDNVSPGVALHDSMRVYADWLHRKAVNGWDT